MLSSVKIASVKVTGDKRSDVESKVGKNIFKICNKKLFDNKKSISCSVEWTESDDNSNFCAIMNIFYNYDDSDVQEMHCKVCKETHNLFYCNRQYNCNQCSFAAYKYRKKERNNEMKKAGRYILNKDK